MSELGSKAGCFQSKVLEPELTTLLTGENGAIALYVHLVASSSSSSHISLSWFRDNCLLNIYLVPGPPQACGLHHLEGCNSSAVVLFRQELIWVILTLNS